jgi:uncharacterized protein
MNQYEKLPSSPTMFNPNRVFVRDLGSKILLIDQMNAHWVMVENSYWPLLSLLQSPEVPQNLNSQVAGLRNLLIENGVGVGERPDPQDLNTVIIKLTKKCNIACTYCYDFENGDLAQHGDVDALKDALTQALNIVPEGKTLHIIFHGGEPMLVWDMLETLVCHGETEASKLGRRISFQGQTNLTTLTARKVAFSEAHNIAWGISLDGTADINDRFRKRTDGKGSYAQFERSYQRYGDFVRSFPILSTITIANCDKLLETALHFRDLNMAGWDWSLFQPIGRARDKIDHIGIDNDALLASWQELFGAILQGAFDGFPVQPVLKYLKNFIQGPGENMCMRPRCGAARDLLSISYDGAIEACDCLDRQGPLSPLGFLDETSLAEASETEIAQKIKERDTVKDHCSNCLWFGVCGGTCLAHAGGLQSVDELHCALSQLAFGSIARSLSESTRLFDYLRSCTNDQGRL